MNISNDKIVVNLEGFDINLINVSYYGGCRETRMEPADDPEVEFEVHTGSEIFDSFLEENYHEELEELAFEYMLNDIQNRKDEYADMRYQMRKDEGL